MNTINMYIYITESLHVSRSANIAQIYKIFDAAESGQQMGYQKNTYEWFMKCDEWNQWISMGISTIK